MTILINTNVNIYKFYLKDFSNLEFNPINVGDILILNAQNNISENGAYQYTIDGIELKRLENNNYSIQYELISSYVTIEGEDVLGHRIIPVNYTSYIIDNNVTVIRNTNKIELVGIEEKQYTENLLLTTTHVIRKLYEKRYSDIMLIAYPEMDQNVKLLVQLPEGERQKILDQIAYNEAEWYVTDHNFNAGHCQITSTEANDDDSFYILGNFSILSTQTRDIHVKLNTSTFNNSIVSDGNYKIVVDGVTQSQLISLVATDEGYLRMAVGSTIYNYDEEANNHTFIYESILNDMNIYLPFGYVISSLKFGDSNSLALSDVQLSLSGTNINSTLYITDQDKPGKYRLTVAPEYFNSVNFEQLYYHITLISIV